VPLFDGDHVTDDTGTGFVHTAPSHAQAHLWRYAKTTQPLGQPYQWDSATGLGTCGDWHIGHRVEDAFVSGLELGLRLCGK
jgi:predicted NAD/FAD-dependent oxidoreductase